jgi:hypothetical protein
MELLRCGFDRRRLLTGIGPAAAGMSPRRELGVPMRFLIPRNFILTVLAIALLMATLPGAISRVVQSGNLYLFTRHFFEDMVARLSGPGRFRFILQPVTAAYLGARDGQRDAQASSPPFLLALLCHGAVRSALLRSAAASLRELVAFAIILDLISQYLIFHDIHPGAAVLLGPVLVAIPYIISRALTNRIVRRRKQPPTVGEVRALGTSKEN